MNKCIMLGRLTKDVENRTTEAGNMISRFSIAVGRKFKNAEGNYDADFINCVAFGKAAEFLTKYFKKGDMVGIVGRWTTGSYTNNDGNKVYTNELTVEEVDFAESKNASGNTSAPANDVNDFMPVADGDDELELPFS